MKRVKPYLISAFIAVALGVVFGQTNIFTLMGIGIAILIVGLFAIIIFLFATAERNKKAIEISGYGIVLLLMVVFFTSISAKIKNEVNHNTANRLVERLEAHKKQFGTYPSDLDELGVFKRYAKFHYQPDSIKQEFSLLYLIDGWHYMNYTSKTGKWDGGD